MDLNLFGLFAKVVSDGVTWQETIIIGLFFISSVLITLLVVRGVVKITESIMITCQNSISLLKQQRNK
jgi:hypothetical protein